VTTEEEEWRVSHSFDAFHFCTKHRYPIHMATGLLFFIYGALVNRHRRLRLQLGMLPCPLPSLCPLLRRWCAKRVHRTKLHLQAEALQPTAALDAPSQLPHSRSLGSSLEGSALEEGTACGSGSSDRRAGRRRKLAGSLGRLLDGSSQRSAHARYADEFTSAELTKWCETLKPGTEPMTALPSKHPAASSAAWAVTSSTSSETSLETMSCAKSTSSTSSETSREPISKSSSSARSSEGEAEGSGGGSEDEEVVGWHAQGSSVGRSVLLDAPSDAAPEAVVPASVARHEFGELQLGKRLGRGSFGCVYAAYHPVSAQHVAVKVFRRRRASMSEMIAEARLTMRLDHKHICTTLGTTAVGWIGEGAHDLTSSTHPLPCSPAPCSPSLRPALVMELFDGGTLDELLFEQRPPPPLRERMYLAVELADAVVYLHSVRVVHGDLKPSNVLLTGGDRPHVKLCDLGLAQHLSQDEARRTDLPVRGTPRYMAPEVAFREYSFPADTYSYAVCLYELLHTSPFFPQASSVARLLALVEGERPPAHLDPRECATLDEAERRFASVAAETIEAGWQLRWKDRPPMRHIFAHLSNAL